MRVREKWRESRRDGSRKGRREGMEGEGKGRGRKGRIERGDQRRLKKKKPDNEYKNGEFVQYSK